MTQRQVMELGSYLMRYNNANVNLSDLGWTFTIGKKKRSFGTCNYRTKTIFYSMHFLNESDEKIKDTILHEIAHAIAGPTAKHGYHWQRWAIKLGAKPDRTDVANQATKDHLKSISKYTLTCPKCSNTVALHRKMKRSTSCGKCSPGCYNPAVKMAVTQNY